LFGATPNIDSPDAVLLAAIRSGDERAMTQVYERYSSTVYSVALRVLGDTAAAEDILQEVFMQLWRNAASFDARRGSLPGWLAVITRNRAIDSLRKRRPESDLTEIVVATEPDFVARVDWNRAFEKVSTALGGMPATQRSALEMAFFDGLTHIEIAEKTGDPLGTIKTRIRAGLAALRKAVNS
jgi:RNA polymerase sigma-70 factor (ECF subfamily)